MTDTVTWHPITSKSVRLGGRPLCDGCMRSSTSSLRLMRMVGWEETNDVPRLRRYRCPDCSKQAAEEAAEEAAEGSRPTVVAVTLPRKRGRLARALAASMLNRRAA